jgi:hypothetical protein
MKYLKWVIAISFGALAGFAYWYFVGCNSGSCAITASPVNSSIYGGVMAALLFNTFASNQKSDSKEKGEQ